MNLELLVINNQELSGVYSDDKALDELLKSVASHCTGIVLDAETDGGRKEITSLAYKIARSKTALDNAGKAITEEWKKKSAVIDAKRKYAWDFLEKLQKEVRKPLTDFEAKEKARVDLINNRIFEIKKIGMIDQVRVISDDKLFAVDVYAKVLDQLKLIAIDESFAEFQEQAAGVLALAKENIAMLLDRAKEKVLREQQALQRAQELKGSAIQITAAEIYAVPNTLTPTDKIIPNSIPVDLKLPICSAKTKVDFFCDNGVYTALIYLSGNQFIRAVINIDDSELLKSTIGE